MWKKPMKKPGIVVNAHRCMACYACFMACKDEHCGWDTALSKSQPEMGQYWVNIVDYERGDSPRRIKTASYPLMCGSFNNPAFEKAIAEGTMVRREDGIVYIDPEKSKGHKELVDASPIGGIFWNEEEQIPQKCTMCAELLDDPDYPGFEPRCVEACPNQCLSFGDLADPESTVSKLIAKNKVTPLPGTEGLDTNVIFLNVPSAFLAGTVAYPKELEEVCIGAKVKLTGADGSVREMVTNWAGDYEFEDLPRDTAFTVEITMDGFKPVVIETATGADNSNADHYVGITYLEEA